MRPTIRHPERSRRSATRLVAPLRIGRAPWLIVILIAALACSPQPQSPESNTAPKIGGQLKHRLATDPADWDVTYTGYCNTCEEGISQAYNTLLGFKAGPGVRYEEFIIQPELAERWEVNSNATVYTFHLRKDVTYANLPPVNGRELTSADVKWAIEYLTRSGELKDKKLPPYVYSWMFEGLDRVEAPDPHTAVVRFQQPFAPFLSYTASSDNPIMPKEIYEQDGHLKDRIVGSVDELKRAVPLAQVYEYLSAGPNHMYMNTRLAPLNDVRVRRAISLGLDRDEFLKVLFNGKGGWALAGAFPDTFTQEEMRQILRYDPTEAKRLLAEAGHGSGLDIDLNYAAESNPEDYLTQIQLLQSQLKKIGININFKVTDRPTYLARRRQGDFVMNTTGKAVQGDVDSYVFAVFHPKSSANYGGVNDPELTTLLEAQRAEPDPAKRRETVRSAVRLIHEKAWQLALYTSPVFEFWHPQLKNFSPHFQGNSLLEAWLER